MRPVDALQEKLENLRSEFATWRSAQEPVEWGEDDGGSFPIYSEEVDRKWADFQKKIDHLASRVALYTYRDAFYSMTASHASTLASMRQKLAEATASGHWLEIEDDEFDRSNWDVEITQLELKAHHFGITHAVSDLLMTSLPESELSAHQNQMMGLMEYRLSCLVWGVEHQPIVSRAKHTVKMDFSTPATWWQHFKRDVLRFKKVKERVEHREAEVTMAVSAVPFTAFPASPFVLSDLGPRINVMIPRGPRFSEHLTKTWSVT